MQDIKANCTIKNVLAKKILGKIQIAGWIRTKRDSKAGLSFIQLNDGSCLENLQIIANQDLPNYSEIKGLTTGCSISIIGELVQSQGAKQEVELQATSIVILGEVGDPNIYPLPPKRHTMEYLREIAHLRPRTNTIAAVARIRHQVCKIIHDYLDQQGFFWVHTPIITTNDCEGAGELFKISTLQNLHNQNIAEDFFGKEAFLTVSGQLNVEAYCLALSRVYTFGPTFRAENSNTSRHLAEFWMIEPEIAFADLNDTIAFAQDMLQKLFTKILDIGVEDLSLFANWIDKSCMQRLESLINTDFECMSYTAAIKHLEKAQSTNKAKFVYPVQWGLDLQSEHERYLAEQLCQKPVVITDYPRDLKGFYMRVNDDQKTVAAFDVLVPGIGEVIGGSQREERLLVLEDSIVNKGMSKESLSWYLDLRKYGTVPHSGFGLGLERILSFITGMGNVRDLIPFPRTPKNANF